MPETDTAEDLSEFITFLFTDIEGSTRLLSQHGGALGPVIASHFNLLTDSVGAEAGVVFETVGDAVYAAFQEPLSALRAAADIQRRVAVAEWTPIEELRVRIAIHSGQVVRRGDHYFGAALFQCSRLQALAWGDQVLVSASTADALRGDALGELRLPRLGRYRLKDLADAIEVYQLAGPLLRLEFPPLRSSEGPPSNLPGASPSLIGRSRELAELRALMSDVRLVTLIGSGGTGKTRLALEVAARAQSQCRDGVFLVELAGLRKPADIAPLLISLLGIRPRPHQTPIDAAVEYLSDRQILLILDNLEQIPGAPAVVRQLLEAGPEVLILATSRAPLSVRGEHRYAVAPLRLDGEAVELFVERARETTYAQPPDGADLPAIAEICARLDGLPLAIELAVARLPVLGVRGLLDGLARRLPLLTDHGLGLPPRQRTLRDTITWSIALLSDAERRAFDVLGVFSGAFSLSAASVVMDRPQLESMDLVGALLDKSLLTAREAPAGDPQFAMLETIRELAAEQLEANSEVTAVRDRHLACVVASTERAALWLVTDRGKNALRLLASIQEDVRRAVEWAIATGHGAAACRIGGSLWRYGYLTGELAELDTLTALALGNYAARDEPRARALNARAVGLTHVGDFAGAEAALREAEEILEDGGPADLLADVVNNRGLLRAYKARSRAAIGLFRRSARLWSQTGADSILRISPVLNLGIMLMWLGRLREAEAQFSVADRLPNFDDPETLAALRVNRGDLLLRLGDAREAAELYQSAIELEYGIRNPLGVVEAAEGLVEAMIQLGEYRRAAALFGAGESLRESRNLPRKMAEEGDLYRAIQRAEDVLSSTTWNQIIGEGRSLSFDALVELARHPVLEGQPSLAPLQQDGRHRQP